jgi:crossover junction endodeoxyribonuclease RusA
MLSELTVEVPTNEWLSSNQRPHWAAKSRKTKALRERAYYLAKAQKLTAPTPASLIVEVGYPKRGRADPENGQPTYKALIDGMVDAGVIPDDDSSHIVETRYRRGARSAPGWHRVRFIFEEE